MPAPDFAVRRLAAAELPLLREWANAERWNPGTHDGPAFHAADSDGFFVGELAGEPVACVSCVRYADRYGFLGQYIVRPGFRGRGFGLGVWAAGMAHLAGRSVGLDGVLAQVPNYERSGFRLVHHHVRHAGVGGGEAPAGLVAAAAVPFPALATYDERLFGAPRPAFLRAWLAIPGGFAVAAVSGDAVNGYGAIRPSADGYKIGPLFAADTATADALLRGLLARVPGAAVCLDAPEAVVNPHAADLVRRHGWAEVFRTARMATAAPPPVPWAEVYGVTSLELG